MFINSRLVTILFLTLVGAVMLAAFPSAGFPLAVDQPILLFNGKDLTGWRTFVDPRQKVDPKEVWSVVDGAIRCEGQVNGYLITEEEYENYELNLEWRWGSKVHTGRNSGVFVHVTGPDQIWPKGVEAQLMAGRAGDFWLVGGFKLKIDESRRDPATPRHFFHLKDGVEKPLGEWNHYRILCDGGLVRLTVNGVLQNEGTDAEVTKGRILLQSEGAEIWFRNIQLARVKGAPSE
jgi:hypothetical protein